MHSSSKPRQLRPFASKRARLCACVHACVRACVRVFVCKCSLSHQPQSKAIREARWWAGLSVNSCALTEEACNKKLTVTKSRLTHRSTSASKHWGQQWGHDIVWFHMFAGTRVSQEWQARHPWAQTEHLHTPACLQTNTVLGVIWLKCNQTGLFYPEFKQCSLWEAQHWLWFSWACTFPHWKHKLLPAWKTTEVAAQHSNSFFLGVSHLGSCSTWAGQKSWNNKQYPSFYWNKQTCQQDCEVETSWPGTTVSVFLSPLSHLLTHLLGLIKTETRQTKPDMRA